VLCLKTSSSYRSSFLKGLSPQTARRPLEVSSSFVLVTRNRSSGFKPDMSVSTERALHRRTSSARSLAVFSGSVMHGLHVCYIRETALVFVLFIMSFRHQTCSHSTCSVRPSLMPTSDTVSVSASRRTGRPRHARRPDRVGHCSRHQQSSARAVATVAISANVDMISCQTRSAVVAHGT
jgi:hypothetical protein